MIRKIIDKLAAANILLHTYRTTDPHMEPIYRALFLKELARAGVDDEFYPVGGAANHSFLYFIARAMNEFEFHNILELGAGQSSIVIDRMKNALARNCNVRTVEHDAFWAGHIRERVNHDVINVPLRPLAAHDREIEYYDIDANKIGRDVDFFIVDGPPAHNVAIRYARLGAFDLIKPSLAKDFVIVVDDRERAGEEALTNMLHAHFRERGIEYAASTIKGAKSQAVFASGRFRSAAYF